jgi:hypothetical protein
VSYHIQVMNRRYHLSRRRRILWIGAVLFCLLFQQLAMAAYVCTGSAMPGGTSMTGDCAAAMGGGAMAKATQAQHSPDPRCTEHCADHATTAHDARLPAVPPLLLPSASPVLLGSIAHAPEQAALPDPALRRPEPPPMLRFCALLI